MRRKRGATLIKRQVVILKDDQESHRRHDRNISYSHRSIPRRSLPTEAFMIVSTLKRPTST